MATTKVPSPTAVRMARLILHALRERDILQSEFATRVGYSEKHLSQVLTGKATAYPGTLDAWAKELGLTFHVELR